MKNKMENEKKKSPGGLPGTEKKDTEVKKRKPGRPSKDELTRKQKEEQEKEESTNEGTLSTKKVIKKKKSLEKFSTPNPIGPEFICGDVIVISICKGGN